MTRLFIPPTIRHVARDRGIGYSIAISVTGTRCDLMCRHCYARTLEAMHSVEHGLKLIDSASSWPRMLLVSGGCDYAGRIPLTARARKLIQRAKSRSFVVSIHTCVTDYSYAKTLRELGVDVVLIDIELDPTVIHFVRNLHKHSEEVFIESLAIVRRLGLNVFPHIVVGLHPRGRGVEYEAIERLTTIDIDGLSIVVFTPPSRNTL